MAKPCSPLRYPGGKSAIFGLVAELLKLNKLERCDYAEPYAGGGGLALSLLFGGYVSEIHLNDIDASVWSFWKAVLDRTDDFIDLMYSTPVNMDTWHEQKHIQQKASASKPVELGFAAFFLNRVNRSGIIQGAGVIGGKEQTGNYLMDCRFNKPDLERRIRRIAKYRNRIHLYRNDAIAFMQEMARYPDSTFLCTDPPYFNKGRKLYTSFYNPGDHADVATQVLQLENPWIVTYDNVPEIQALYKTRRQFAFDINYSLQTKRIGTELLIASKGLRVTESLRDEQLKPPARRAA